jgi:hypothetical protein
MNGTLNATARRNILTDDHDVQNPKPDVVQPIIPVVQKPVISPPVQQQPAIVHQPIVTQPIVTQPVQHKPVQQQPIVTHASQLVNTQAPEIPELMKSINEIKDQYVKISMSIGQIGSVKNDLSTYKKITDARIEKIANLFLSINK